MNKLKVAIAGHGLVGRRRHEFIDIHPDMEVVAVSDQRYTEPRGMDGGIPCFNDFRLLIDGAEFDALFVCLPNDVAPEATIGGLEKKAHVFCEKPPGRNLGDIRSVQAVEEKHPGLKLKYGFNHRYHDSVREALELVQGGKLGKLVNMRGVYGKSVLTPKFEGVDDINHPLYWRAHREKAGGGILLDQGIHMVDLMRCFAGDFTDISSFVNNDFWGQDVEDNAYALLRAESGVVAMLHSSATQWRHKFSLEMTLEEGAIILSGILSSTKSYGQETLTIAYREGSSNGNPRETTTSYIHDNSWREEIEDFASCILEDKPVTVGSSDDAYKSMELVYRIYMADPEWQSQFGISLG